MLDRDLAALYGVETRALNQAVRRHLKRFPPDFMFQLNAAETRDWVSRFVTANPSVKMSIRIPPLAFTEQGVAMLSSVLNSERAVQANIAIMRTFVKIRQTLGLQKELAQRLKDLENKIVDHDAQIQSIFDAIRDLMEPPAQPKPEIGFKADK
jgi:hypothetical protein